MDELNDEIPGEVESAELCDDDYGFIFDSEGNLKAVYFPNDKPLEHPKNIKKLLKMFNVSDVDLLDNPTIH